MIFHVFHDFGFLKNFYNEFMAADLRPICVIQTFKNRVIFDRFLMIFTCFCDIFSIFDVGYIG